MPVVCLVGVTKAPHVTTLTLLVPRSQDGIGFRLSEGGSPVLEHEASEVEDLGTLPASLEVLARNMAPIKKGSKVGVGGWECSIMKANQAPTLLR